tara:strand:+ start:1775 stop:1975 length:201 start_codon:yes stop_codon:yes gene_type:complete
MVDTETIGTFKASPGITIYDFCEELQELADRLNESVRGQHNSYYLVATPNHKNVDYLLDQWRDQQR